MTHVKFGKMGVSETERPTLRAQQLALTRERILDALLALLERGADDTSLRAVASEAGIAERTLYRHFATREDLASALGPRLQGRTGEPLPASYDELEDYAERLLTRFEENAALVRGLLRSENTHHDLQRTRSRNLGQLQALIDRAFPDAPEADRRAAAATLRAQLSGAGWAYLRLSCGLPQREVLDAARWSIASTTARLRACARAAKKARSS